MQIIAKCPDCSNNLLFDASAADRRITCSSCGRLFKIPNLDEVRNAVKVIKKSKGVIYVDEKGQTYA